MLVGWVYGYSPIKRRSVHKLGIWKIRCPVGNVVVKGYLSAIKTRSDNPITYDVTIIGAGIAGSCFAAALGSFEIFKNLKIAVVDPNDIKDVANWIPPTDSFNTGAWKYTYADRVMPYSKVVVTDFLGQGSLNFADLISEGVSSEHPAFLIENSNLHSACAKALIHNNNSNITFFQGKVVNFSSFDSSNSTTSHNYSDNASSLTFPQILLSSNQTIRSKLVVAADGSNSLIRRYANIPSSSLSYNQFGLVANLVFDQLNQTAFQRFLPTGPIAILPLSNGFANLVWSIDSHYVDKLKNVSDITFIKLVNMAFRYQNYSDFEYILNSIHHDGSLPESLDLDQEFNWRINSQNQNGSFSTLINSFNEPIQLPPLVMDITPNSRQGFPLRISNSKKYYSSRIALIGDAAHTMHPLAGMGFNSGVTDSIQLCSLLKNAILTGSDIGSKEYVLKPYNDKRYSQNVLLQAAVDHTFLLFQSQNKMVTCSRGILMNLLNKFPLIKNNIVKSIMY
ncbi:hypothetical protein BB561_001660 [Smittium simulii]|uniref:FAD-binding domain-containing protein n=1 Tax=Smittium simulii TaxID=133385 RepID=A0A2T9YTS3_9FUNG|nr:hypothetical protein BB561_001660 [Smittium simulii]